MKKNQIALYKVTKDEFVKEVAYSEENKHSETPDVDRVYVIWSNLLENNTTKILHRKIYRW